MFLIMSERVYRELHFITHLLSGGSTFVRRHAYSLCAALLYDSTHREIMYIHNQSYDALI